MRSVFFASLRTYMRRYVAAAIAVIVAVAFVVVLGVLMAAARSGIMAGDGAPYRGADFVVRAKPDAAAQAPACCPGTLDTPAAIAMVERLGDNAAGLGRVLLPAHTADGAALGAGETAVGPVAAAQALRWQKLVSGRFPSRMGEAVVHVWDAHAWKIAVGDRIRLGEGATAADVQIVGLVESPSTWTQASVYVTWPQYLRWRGQPSFHVGSIAVRGDVGRIPEGMSVQPAAQFVTNGLTKLNHGVDTIALMLVLFGGVALFVAALVIANTFSILFAQRLRELALLRCVGATRGQVVGAVRSEAAVVGTVASSMGTLAGVGVGYGLVAVINGLAPRPPLGIPALPLPWLLGAFAIGILVTMLASWLPARGVVRLSPLAALHPHGAVDVQTATGRARLAIAVFLLLVGTGLLGMSTILASKLFMVIGGIAVFMSVLLFGPWLFPRLIRSAGALLGPIERLAAENAARNPRRTATTAAALLAGVTLMTAVLTGMATWRTALDQHRDRQLPIDIELTSPDKPIGPSLLDQVRSTPGVEHAITVDGTLAKITGWDAPIPLITAPEAAAVARDGGAFARVEPGTIRLDRDAFRSPHKELGIAPGRMVKVRVGAHEVELKAVFLGGWGQAGLVSPETLAQLTDAPQPRVIWVRASADADRLQLVGDLEGVARTAGVDVHDRLQARAAGDRQLDVLTWSVLALLGISVAIALIGIANTLALSVLERAREHALLRALGLTRGQLRRMLATEALLLSTIAALLGMAIGVGFAWVAYRAIVKRVLSEAVMQIPWLSLGVLVLLTALAGLLASVLPARRAARVSSAGGLALD
ncbi:FtsX-like permease family protein [Dyella sp. LX-66]|uniref:ABC transporter permease n=1 Tax=unclassified Dyella TaxID=2634549 RepID=UPI001BE118B5|nr:MULTISPECIES: FtsX-like permease family protein [unclassified Dyella]MBT2118552.1 FtsX-like permease family protein [Dyella sp. LX-1]MBT2142023.1 FtsX-like permease family protein [Dyella sp. LX-66]